MDICLALQLCFRVPSGCLWGDVDVPQKPQMLNYKKKELSRIGARLWNDILPCNLREPPKKFIKARINKRILNLQTTLQLFS